MQIFQLRHFLIMIEKILIAHESGLVPTLWKMADNVRSRQFTPPLISEHLHHRNCYHATFWLCEILCTVYPTKYAHGFVVLCFVVVMQSFIMNSHEVFIHIHQGCFAGTGAIVRLPQCQWSKLDGYGKISQCITTTKHSKAKTECIFLGIYCNSLTHLVLACMV